MPTRKPPPSARVKPIAVPFWPANAMTVREAAKKWNVSPWMVRVWVQEGRVKAVYGVSQGTSFLGILQADRPPRLVPQTKYVPSAPAPATFAPVAGGPTVGPRGPVPLPSDTPRPVPPTGPAFDIDLLPPTRAQVFAPAPEGEPAAAEGAPARAPKKRPGRPRKQPAREPAASTLAERRAQEIARTAAENLPASAPASAPARAPEVEIARVAPIARVDDLDPFGDT